MLFGEWIRRTVFWMLDFLRGSSVRKHYLDIQSIMDNGMDPNVRKIREQHLNSILKYATENVEFYKQFRGYASLESFPVIDKNIIRKAYDDFHSPEYIGANVVLMHTSGSTGTPFVVRQDKNKRNRVYAEMMYFWSRADYQIGMRYIFLRIWTAMNRKSVLSAWARNMLMIDIQRQDAEYQEQIRHTLKSDHKIIMLLGYANILDNLATYLLAQGDTPDMFSLRSVISIAEMLPENTREKLKKVFACDVVSSYSNQENGTLAQECLENKEFHLNSASYYFELLKLDSDEPAEIGEVGRIVITDLFNHAMPLIRYDTGDTATWKAQPECGWHSQAFSVIQGRMRDFLYDTKGDRMSPYIIAMLMWPFDKLLQYQIIQEGAKQYVLKLNGAMGHYDDAVFVNLVREALGKEAEVTIEHVNEIPVLASGKRKNAVCNYVKEQD
jgi:phenylacetate-CoA ligase